MKIDFPIEIDYIIHADLDKLDYLQRIYLDLLNKNSNFVNTSFNIFFDRISRKYNSKENNKILEETCSFFDEEEHKCPYEICYDDFVKIAVDSFPSLKKCINNPSTKLIKETKMVKANKVTRFDSKTMTWLARRPGRTISEKIGSKNMMPTQVTRFTPDTIENRHMMYLYNILYDNLIEKIYPKNGELPCDDLDICPKANNCDNCELRCFKKYDILKKLVFLKNTIRKTDLIEVKKEKQFKQNNKLMEHKEYKQIWDSVREIDFYEENCRSIWDNLKQRYQMYIFFKICSKLMKEKSLKIVSSNMDINTDNGKLNINIENKKDCKVLFIDDINDIKYVVSIDCGKEKLKIEKYGFESIDDTTFNEKLISSNDYDLSNIFDKFNDYKTKIQELENSEDKLNGLENDITSLENIIKNYKFNLDEYKYFKIFRLKRKKIYKHVKLDFTFNLNKDIKFNNLKFKYNNFKYFYTLIPNDFETNLEKLVMRKKDYGRYIN